MTGAMGMAGKTKAVLFLWSDMASYITRHTIPVDGGLIAANLVATPRRLTSARAF